MVVSPSEGSHADYWSKRSSMTLGVNAVVLQEDLCQWWYGLTGFTQV